MDGNDVVAGRLLPNRKRLAFWVLSIIVLYTQIYTLKSIDQPSTLAATRDKLDLPRIRETATSKTTFSNSSTKKVSATTSHSSSIINATKTTTSGCDTICNIVLSGNDAYLDDLTTWWYHCKKVGLCCDDSREYCCSRTTFYAEDEAIFRKLESSKILRIKKSWETGTSLVNFNLTGRGRFTYNNRLRFSQMVARRPSILLKELEEAAAGSDDGEGGGRVLVVYFDLDTFLLQDPRPYFIDDYDIWGHHALNQKSGPFNTGMLAMRPTIRTIQVISEWKKLLEEPTKPTPNQRAFNLVLKEFNSTIRSVLLPESAFLAGKPYEGKEKDIPPLSSEIVMFHNNYCEKRCSKVERAKNLGLWHPLDVGAILG